MTRDILRGLWFYTLYLSSTLGICFNAYIWAFESTHTCFSFNTPLIVIKLIHQMGGALWIYNVGKYEV